MPDSWELSLPWDFVSQRASEYNTDVMNLSRIFTILLLVGVAHGCLDDRDRNNRGKCIDSMCDCDDYYVGSNCVFYPYYFGAAYQVYHYFSVVINSVLLGCSVIRLVQFWKHSKGNYKTFGTRHLAVGLVTLACFSRTLNVFLVVDGNWNRWTLLWGIEFFIYYPLMLSAYACELVLWLELYSTTAVQDIERLPHYRKILFVVNAIVFPTEIITRISIGLFPPLGNLLDLCWTIYLGILVLLECIGFLIIGGLLVRRVQRMQAITAQEAQRKTFLKLSWTLGAITVLLMVGLGVLAGTYLYQNPWEYYGVLFAARIVEFIIAGLMLFIARPPFSNTPSPSCQTSIPLSSIRRDSV